MSSSASSHSGSSQRVDCPACTKQQQRQSTAGFYAAAGNHASIAASASSSVSASILPYSPESYDDDEEDEDEEELDHVPSCTYTTPLRPLDPAARCALSNRKSKSMGILSVSFSGCGAFYPYMYGIACYLQDHYDLSEVHFLGTSGGCLPALTLATGLDVRTSFYEKWNNHVIAESAAKPLKAYFNFISICHKHAHAYFDEEVHLRANGRLHLSTSRLQLRPQQGWSLWNTVKAMAGGIKLLQNQRTSHWTSKADLIDNVAASTYIPILVDLRDGLVKSWRGEWHLDGGITDNQPILDNDTIQLQPFMFYKASMLVKASFIYIRLSPEWHATLFKQGYDHAAEHAERVFATLPKKIKTETRPVVPPEIEELIRKKQKESPARTRNNHEEPDELEAV